MKKNEFKKIGMLVLPIAVIALLVIMFVIMPQRAILKQDSIEIDVKIIPDDASVGFNVDTDALHFGAFPAGYEIYRPIGVHNEMDKEVVVLMSFSGDLAGWMHIEEGNRMVLKPNTDKNATVYMTVPMDAEADTYTGQLNLVYKKKLPWMIW